MAGEYPFSEGQEWAEADVGQAVDLLDAVIMNPAKMRAITARGQRDIRLSHSYRAVGLRILDRVQDIKTMLAQKKVERGARRRRTRVTA